jgi:SAM-dependent methyltransferase
MQRPAPSRPKERGSESVRNGADGSTARSSRVHGERDWRALFEESYAWAPSTVAERVWREVFGDEYPEGVDPNSFISVSELERIAGEVAVGADETLADLGCGRGGPGLWVAMATRSRLIGIDIAESALEAARRRADALGFGNRASFRRGSFEETALPTSSADAVMSVDALLFAQDKALALRELRRILRDSGRLVFTSWDYHAQPVGRPPQVADHRPLLRDAEFDVLAYEETKDWRRRAMETSAGLLAKVDELAAESGAGVDEIRSGLEEMRASIDAMSRRVLVVAEAR